MSQDPYLMHHGIKGMKWGVRRFEDANGHLTPEGKRRYAVQDARKYYKINRLQRAKEQNRDPDKNAQLNKRIRRVQTRSDRKHADLTQKDLNVGREIVAKNRRNWAMVGTAAKAAATAAGAYVLYQNPKTRALVPAALIAGGALTYGSAKKVPYYTMEARRYKQVNPKGATNKGLSKKQQMLRKVGKAAVTGALIGAAGYTLYKTGGAKVAIARGKDLFTNLRNRNQNGSKIELNSLVPSNVSHKKEKTNTIKNVAKNFGKKAGEFIFTDDARNTAKKATKAVKNAGSRVVEATSNKIKSNIRNRVMNNVDDDDIRTWSNAVKNTKNLADDIKRYRRAISKLRKGDKVGAASEVSDEITGTTNKMIKKTNKQINKIKNRFNKRRKSK